MIIVKIEYWHDEGIETQVGANVGFTDEFIKDDIEGVLEIVKLNFEKVLVAAEKRCGVDA